MAFSLPVITRRLGLLLGLLLSLAPAAWAQTPTWQAVVLAAPTTTTSETSITATATDASGNVYVAGSVAGTASLGGTSLTSLGQSSLFVAKWSPTTQAFVWVLQSGGTGLAYPTALAVSGNQVYLTGYFQGAPAFGSTTFTSAGNNDAFVAKLTDQDSSAAFAWAYRAGGTGLDQGNALAVQGAAVYVAGEFAGVATFGSATYTSTGGSAAFLTRFTDAGSSATFAWTQPVGSTLGSLAYGVAVQGSSVYFTGYYNGTMAFGNTSLTNVGLYGLFVAKLTDTGSSPTYTWAKQANAGSMGKIRPSALAVQGNQVYLTGDFAGTAAFGPTLSLANSTSGYGYFWATDIFVAKLVDAGATADYVWAIGAGGPEADGPGALAVRGTSVYIAGSVGGTAVFGNRLLVVSSLSSDAFVAKLTDAGSTASFAWAQAAGGPNTDDALALAPTGTAVYVGGYIRGTASFGPQAVGTAGQRQAGFFTALPDATGLATGVGAATALARVALYPTPTPSGTQATVQLPAGLAAGPATLTLLDAVGRPVRATTVALAAGATATTFDVAGLAPGVYALRVAVGERRGTARLVIE